METAIRNIPIEEPFKKTWSEASTIISEEELENDETDTGKPETQRIVNGHTELTKDQSIEIVKRLRTGMPDIVIRSDSDSQRQGQVQGQSQGRIPPEVFKTPQKCHSEIAQRLQNLHAEKHKHSLSVMGDKSDWMLAERSNSRSPPSPALLTRSPDIRSRSPMLSHVASSPSLHHGSSPSVFNFSPERTEPYQREQELESSRVKKRLFEGMGLGYEIPVPRDTSQHNYLCDLPSPSSRHRDHFQQLRHFLSREPPAREEHLAPEVPYFVESSTGRRSPSNYHDADRFRAKRRLELDEEYVSTPKRLKSEIEREMGYRYLHQLETDIASLSDKLYTSKPEVKPTSCTCAIMEKQFLAMAESAYRSVRRLDASPRGFEQFRRELIQTNQVMKDSIDVLKNIRSFCEHKC